MAIGIGLPNFKKQLAVRKVPRIKKENMKELKYNTFKTRKVSTNFKNPGLFFTKMTHFKLGDGLSEYKNIQESKNAFLHECGLLLYSKIEPLRVRVLRKRFKDIQTRLFSYLLNLTSHRYVTQEKNNTRNRVLNLNFTRNRFFPSVRSFFKGNVYITLSLGLFSKFFLKPKCFTKSKTVYLTTAAFLRKVLLYCSLPHLYLFINKTPKYFNEILAKINEPAIPIYKNPFPNPNNPNQLINEYERVNTFAFSALMFFNNKKYGLVKMRKRGRLKRKIFRRLVSSNRVLD